MRRNNRGPVVCCGGALPSTFGIEEARLEPVTGERLDNLTVQSPPSIQHCVPVNPPHVVDQANVRFDKSYKFP